MITIVAAIGENFELAKDDGMLWHLPDDYARFKAITRNHPVILGRNSVETMPDIIAERILFVLSRNVNYHKKGIIRVEDIATAIQKAQEMDDNSYIIGGGQIYHLGIDFADKMELTRVHGDFPSANIFFPYFSTTEWTLIHQVSHSKDENHAFEFTYETWIRSQK